MGFPPQFVDPHFLTVYTFGNTQSRLKWYCEVGGIVGDSWLAFYTRVAGGAFKPGL